MRLISILICAAACFLLLTGAGPETEKQVPEITPLLTANYADILLREIKAADRSIDAALYSVNYQKDIDYAIENRVLEALVRAGERGVKVRIILDCNVSRAPDADPGALEDRNREAAVYLKAHGITVEFDDHQTLTHCKLIVFDSSSVILGSANWTYAGLKKNNEAGVLIRDKTAAGAYINMIAGIKREAAAE